MLKKSMLWEKYFLGRFYLEMHGDALEALSALRDVDAKSWQKIRTVLELRGIVLDEPRLLAIYEDYKRFLQVYYISTMTSCLFNIALMLSNLALAFALLPFYLSAVLCIGTHIESRYRREIREVVPKKLRVVDVRLISEAIECVLKAVADHIREPIILTLKRAYPILKPLMLGGFRAYMLEPRSRTPQILQGC